MALSVYGYVHPRHRGRGIGASLVAWGERWTHERLPLAPEEARLVVGHYVTSGNAGARLLLEAAGYEAVRGAYVMQILLEDPPPPPGWPEGLGVRTFVPGRD